jgi:hypothetical protein
MIILHQLYTKTTGEPTRLLPPLFARVGTHALPCLRDFSADHEFRKQLLRKGANVCSAAMSQPPRPFFPTSSGQHKPTV